MSRFLFVVPPLAGHVNPAAVVALQLAARGHQVAWAGSQSRLQPMLGPGATIYPTGMRVHRGLSDAGMAALKSLWEGFVIPFARFTLPGVDKAVRAFQPDLLVTDQHALSGALAAQRNGLPWATLCVSSIEFGRPFAALPQVQAWIRAQCQAIRAEVGLPADGAADLLYSPYLSIAFTTTALGGAALPSHLTLVGSAGSARPVPQPAFPWGFLDPGRRHVLVTMGTLAGALVTGPGGFYARAVEALRPLHGEVQAILVAPPELVPDLPGHILATPRVPLEQLLPQLDCVVSHGGLNTVSETLAFGVPLVIAPIRHDQPLNAAQVTAAGAGLRVRFARTGPAQLRDAILAVLDDPRYRAAAAVIGDSFAAAGGAPAAAGHLERLAARAATAE